MDEFLLPFRMIVIQKVVTDEGEEIPFQLTDLECGTEVDGENDSVQKGKEGARLRLPCGEKRERKYNARGMIQTTDSAAAWTFGMRAVRVSGKVA